MVNAGEGMRAQKTFRSRPAFQPVSLAELLRELVDDARLSAESLQLRLRLELRSRPLVAGNRDALARALGNLIQNALEAAPAGSTVKITLRTTRASIIVDILDRGPGVPPALIHKVFAPFVSTRPDHGGLGLTVAQQLARAHGGRVRFVRCAPTVVRFELPRPLVN
jgi:signal transduction histidine kinase